MAQLINRIVNVHKRADQEALVSKLSMLVRHERFFRSAEGRAGRNLTAHTHVSSRKDCHDWFLGNGNGRLSFEYRDLQTLRLAILELFDAGVPPLISESLTSEFRLFHVLEFQYSGVEPDFDSFRLWRFDSPFLGLLAESIRDAFPSATASLLDAFIFEGAGVSETTRTHRVMLKLVWPKVITNYESAVKLRNYFLANVTKQCKEAAAAKTIREASYLSPEEEAALARKVTLREIINDLQVAHPENVMEQMFDAHGIYSPRSRVRLAYCDDSTKAPSVRADGRPLLPKGVVRFKGAEATRLLGPEGLARAKWIQVGCVTEAKGFPVTPFELVKHVLPPPSEIAREKRRNRTYRGSPGSVV